jgi:hypothetical protein
VAKKFNINVDLWRFQVEVVITKNIKKSALKLYKDEVEGPAEAYFLPLRCIHSGNVTGAIFLQPKAPAAVVAHECLHAVNYILRKRGVKPSFENDEPQAYLLTYLMAKIQKRLKK